MYDLLCSFQCPGAVIFVSARACKTSVSYCRWTRAMRCLMRIILSHVLLLSAINWPIKFIGRTDCPLSSTSNGRQCITLSVHLSELLLTTHCYDRRAMAKFSRFTLWNIILACDRHRHRVTANTMLA